MVSKQYILPPEKKQKNCKKKNSQIINKYYFFSNVHVTWIRLKFNIHLLYYISTSNEMKQTSEI